MVTDTIANIFEFTFNLGSTFILCARPSKFVYLKVTGSVARVPRFVVSCSTVIPFSLIVHPGAYFSRPYVKENTDTFTVVVTVNTFVPTVS